jgi:threonyl-tRNA synthetase
MLIRSDQFSYQVTGKTSVAEFTGELATGEDRAQVEDALVAFVAVETTDEADPQDVTQQAVTR